MVKHLTLKLGCWVDYAVLDYLMQLDGIDKVEVNEDKDTLDIYYNDVIISLMIILMEIEFVLQVQKIPYVIGFDKHSNKVLKEKEVIVDLVCCEYCVMGNIYDLLGINGIDKVCTDYDGIKSNNIKFFISYDDNIISEEDVNNWKYI